MGLSVIISGGVIAIVLFSVLFAMPTVLDKLVSVSEVTSEVSVIEEGISQTDTRTALIDANSGQNVINLELYNDGDTKLWDFKNFNLLVTYDANIGGTKKTVTEKFSYNGDSAFDPSIAQTNSFFKIQRGTSIITSGTTTTITEGIDFEQCVGDCFIKQVSSRNSGNGPTSGASNEFHDDFEVFISNVAGLTSPGGTIIFERDATVGDTRFAWEIWEYNGIGGHGHEMTVLDIGTCTFSGGGGSALICTGPAVAPTNDSDVVVFVTGRSNHNGSDDDIQRCLTTSAWDGGNNQPVFNRGESGDNCDISYAVVEWTGSNWTVERVEHTFTGASTQTETLTTDVVDIKRAFFHTQQRNDGGGCCDDSSDSGSEVQLTATNTITYRLPFTQLDWGSDMVAVTWVISSSDTSSTKMIVNHYNPGDHGTGATEEENWQESITAVADMGVTVITGLSGQSEETSNNLYPSGYVAAMLRDVSSVDMWQSETSPDINLTFQVTELPGASTSLCISESTGSNINTNEWTVDYIFQEIYDAQILNTDECAAITIKLSNNLYTSGPVIVTISTDNGVVTTKSVSIV